MRKDMPRSIFKFTNRCSAIVIASFIPIACNNASSQKVDAPNLDSALASEAALAFKHVCESSDVNFGDIRNTLEPRGWHLLEMTNGYAMNTMQYRFTASGKKEARRLDLSVRIARPPTLWSTPPATGEDDSEFSCDLKSYQMLPEEQADLMKFVLRENVGVEPRRDMNSPNDKLFRNVTLPSGSQAKLAVSHPEDIHPSHEPYFGVRLYAAVAADPARHNVSTLTERETATSSLKEYSSLFENACLSKKPVPKRLSKLELDGWSITSRSWAYRDGFGLKAHLVANDACNPELTITGLASNNGYLKKGFWGPSRTCRVSLATKCVQILAGENFSNEEVLRAIDEETELQSDLKATSQINEKGFGRTRFILRHKGWRGDGLIDISIPPASASYGPTLSYTEEVSDDIPVPSQTGWIQ